MASFHLENQHDAHGRSVCLIFPADELRVLDVLVFGPSCTSYNGIILCSVACLFWAAAAGLIAAMTVKRVMPHVSVRVVRSPEIGVIGVGESTTPITPYHFFQYLGLNQRRFYAMVEPTWKMGIHFLWGSRIV